MATFKRTADILQALFVEGGSSDEDEPLDDAETDEDGWPPIATSFIKSQFLFGTT